MFVNQIFVQYKNLAPFYQVKIYALAHMIG